MENDVHTDSTPMDDAVDTGPTEQELLDAVMANSPLMDEQAPPPPAEEEIGEDPEDSDIEDPEESEEAVSEEEEEFETDEVEESNEDGTEVPTQEVEAYTAEDLDLDAQVMVKIDGEEQAVSFGDLMKGYQTDAHLSKQGRELGEARKALDEERTAKLQELTQMGEAAAAMVGSQEQKFAKEYHNLEEQINKAREDGDTYELGELKDKREQTQQKYWKARKQREGLMSSVQEQNQKAQQEQFETQMLNFQEAIPSMIPDFDDKVAAEIREFAIGEGIAEELLGSIVDPVVVKFIDDYRRLKQGVKKGAAKRKTVPAKKALPTKKATPKAKKAEARERSVRNKVMSGDSSKAEQDAFAKMLASRSLNL